MRNSDGEVLEGVSYGVDAPTETQENLVYDVLSVNRHKWMTLIDLSVFTGISSLSSIGSRIRDLRLQGSRIERRLSPLSEGRARLFEYMLSF